MILSNDSSDKGLKQQRKYQIDRHTVGPFKAIGKGTYAMYKTLFGSLSTAKIIKQMKNLEVRESKWRTVAKESHYLSCASCMWVDKHLNLNLRRAFPCFYHSCSSSCYLQQSCRLRLLLAKSQLKKSWFDMVILSHFHNFEIATTYSLSIEV